MGGEDAGDGKYDTASESLGEGEDRVPGCDVVVGGDVEGVGEDGDDVEGGGVGEDGASASGSDAGDDDDEGEEAAAQWRRRTEHR